MISEADFANVFPWMAARPAGREDYKTKPAARTRRRTPWQYDECIARWEDDGGDAWRFSQGHARRAATASQSTETGTDLLRASIRLPSLSALLMLETIAAALPETSMPVQSPESVHKKHMESS